VGFIRVPRTPKQYPDFGKGNCACCGKPIPKGRRKYCGGKCGYEYRFETRTYSVVSWMEIREKILVRDQYKCQDCGAGRDADLEVHHNIPIYLGGEEFDEKNLVTLCEKCHDKRHGKKRQGKEHIKVNQLKLDV